MCQGDIGPLPLKQTLEQLRPQLGGALVDALIPILHLNEKRCRIHRHLKADPQSTLSSYIIGVADHYKTDRVYLNQVQREMSGEVWDPLSDKLRIWAYSFLNSWGLDESTRLVYTVEIAQEASLEIVRSHYPYDCDFDAWACTLTKNVSSKYMQHQPHNGVIDNVDLSEAEEWFSHTDEHASLSGLEVEVARKQSLLDAIAELSENQKELIWKHYFEGWPLSQIADQQGISGNAVYKRHFDALEHLRKILGSNRHKDE